MLTVNAMGDKCPIPVVKTKKAVEGLTADETVEVLVDNETAVQNVGRFAQSLGFAVTSEKLGEGQYRVCFDARKGAAEGSAPAESFCPACGPKKNTVVVVASDKMGEGSDELGAVLIKSFFYALTQQDELPSTVIFYNAGAKLSVEGSPVLEDVKNLAAAGVRIFTCGTCLNFYGIKEKLAVGEVSNMYDIVSMCCGADLIIKP